MNDYEWKRMVLIEFYSDNSCPFVYWYWGKNISHYKNKKRTKSFFMRLVAMLAQLSSFYNPTGSFPAIRVKLYRDLIPDQHPYSVKPHFAG